MRNESQPTKARRARKLARRIYQIAISIGFWAFVAYLILWGLIHASDTYNANACYATTGNVDCITMEANND